MTNGINEKVRRGDVDTIIYNAPIFEGKKYRGRGQIQKVGRRNMGAPGLRLPEVREERGAGLLGEGGAGGHRRGVRLILPRVREDVLKQPNHDALDLESVTLGRGEKRRKLSFRIADFKKIVSAPGD